MRILDFTIYISVIGTSSWTFHLQAENATVTSLSDVGLMQWRCGVENYTMKFCSSYKCPVQIVLIKVGCNFMQSQSTKVWAITQALYTMSQP